MDLVITSLQLMPGWLWAMVMAYASGLPCDFANPRKNTFSPFFVEEYFDLTIDELLELLKKKLDRYRDPAYGTVPRDVMSVLERYITECRFALAMCPLPPDASPQCKDVHADATAFVKVMVELMPKYYASWCVQQRKEDPHTVLPDWKTVFAAAIKADQSDDAVERYLCIPQGRGCPRCPHQH